MPFTSTISEQIQASIAAKSQLPISDINAAAGILVDAFKNHHKLLVAGNGGSAADAQHIAAELVGRYKSERQALPAIAITANSSSITAIGNDYGFDHIFSRHVEALGNRGDVFMAISTSGNSPNIIKAVEAAKARHIVTIGMTGESGGKLAEICDLTLKMPSNDTPRIQECHILVGHILCDLIEKFGLPS